jgi:putative ABC transport system permease protein
VIGEQISYLRNKDLGYNKDQVVIVPTNKDRTKGFPLAELYRTELLKHPQVASVGISIFTFAENSWAELGFTNEQRVYKSFQYNVIDPEFVKSMHLKIIQGRSFDHNNPSDLNSAALVNETFVKEFNLINPVGKKLPGKFDQHIIGIVKDFNFQSLHEKIQPLLLTMTPDSVLRRSENISFAYSPQPRISIRLKPGDLISNINMLRDAWKKITPDQEFEYKFLDETLATQYAEDNRTSTFVKLASFISVFIACMGLFGLATLAVVRRTREIGIRKVMGASIPGIIIMISTEFVKLVFVAAIIAFPLAWWFLKDWLKDFAYQVNISWWVFVVAAVAAIVIALLTVSYQAVRAAMSNPVKSLRTE